MWPWLSKSDRTGRSDRSNGEPNLNPVRLMCKNGPRMNRQKTAKTGKNWEKISEPAGLSGLAVQDFFFTIFNMIYFFFFY
jgi:hypothetical protein